MGEPLSGSPSVLGVLLEAEGGYPSAALRDARKPAPREAPRA